LIPAAAGAIDDAPPASDAITGKEIYQRVIDNKLHTAYFEHRMVSTDPGGSVQSLAFWSRFKDLRTPDAAPTGTIISKTVMKFTDPFDKRDTAYLFIEKKGTEDEGFHYSRKRERRVTRISPAKESIFGTDFSLDDLAVVHHIDDATYVRLPDEEIQGEMVWVVDVAHKPETDPTYARSMLYVAKDRNVPLRTRHWDKAGVEVKQLEIPKPKIKQFAGVWIPMEATMYDLSEKTQSILYLDRVVENPDIPDVAFSPKTLSTIGALGAGANEQGR
ncbi:MAG: outer membrane lipoprotein-sorting protein, partial [Myxococcota bacterium]